MKCTCPKCSAKIELDLDLSTVPEGGTHGKCPQCSAKFPLAKETFASRAVRRAEETSCARCGNPLGHSTFCPACGQLFPDYLAVGAKVQRQQSKSLGESFNFFSRISFAPAAKAKKKTYVTQQKSAKKSAKARALTVVIIVAVVAAAAAGISLYNTHRAEQVFALKYFRAVSIIKFGTDLSLQTCAKTAADWKAKRDAGQAVVPRCSAEDQARLGKARDAAEKNIATLANPPKKFLTAKDKLGKLQDTYKKANSLALAPAGSPQEYADAAAKVEAEFKQAAQELKASLPPALTKELTLAKAKYREMKDF